MLNILYSYSFWVVSIGTVLLAIAAAVIGSLNLYKGQSLIGDAIGHATFPGIVLAFMLMQTREPTILLFGAMATGGICYLLIQLGANFSKVQLDTLLAVFFSGFFGLGMALKSLIQGNSSFQNASQSGLENYIFGQAAYMLEQDVKLIGIITLVVIALFVIFRRQLVLFIFDKQFASSIGINVRMIELILLILTIAVVSVGLKAVGVILISSFLILPCVCANHWSKKLTTVLVISCVCAIFSTLLGVLFSSLYTGLSTGPTIILIMGSITLLSMAFGKYGYFANKFIRPKSSIHVSVD